MASSTEEDEAPSKEEKVSGESEEQPESSTCETTQDDEDYFADVGFMFEASQPVRLERFRWDDIPTGDDDSKRSITVALHVADDAPGAVQSGHYLWPAAVMLADYLVHHHHSGNRVISAVELGAGCALASLAALQLWQETLQCLCVTDHDPGTLVRARDNLETTVQHILADCAEDDDERLNAAINSIASIPVLFESLEWGDSAAVDAIVRNQMQEHIVQGYQTTASVDVVLGSDLIYCADLVEPLFATAAQLIGIAGRFLLSQSFSYDEATEKEIDRVCTSLGLKRVILVDEDNGTRRIQEFTPAEVFSVE